MRNRFATVAILALLALGSRAQAELPALPLPRLPHIPPLPAMPALPPLPLPNVCGTASAVGCYDPDTNPGGTVICHCPPSAAELARIRELDGCAEVDQVICINNFQYNPPLTTAAVGSGAIAWVNVEQCPSNDLPPELIVAGILGIGCDTHHEVLTFPALPGDVLAFEDVCSPYAGCASTSPLGVFPINVAACGASESNVRCHVFENPGIQHYTCETNPGHTALLHGLLIVQP